MTIYTIWFIIGFGFFSIYTFFILNLCSRWIMKNKDYMMKRFDLEHEMGRIHKKAFQNLTKGFIEVECELREIKKKLDL